MNIRQIVTICVAGMVMGAMALDFCEVTGVKARQRYPWNGLVDIDFTLDSKATEPYQMFVTVFDNVGKTNLPVKSVYAEGVSFANNPCMVHKDTSRIIWNAAADLPDGFRCTNVLVTCQDVRTIEDEKRYMIIDLSGGPSASAYPISYVSAPPSGGWTEEHMTTKLVLRRVDAGSFLMGSPLSESGRQSNEDQHKVTLTKPFYIGIYQVTEKQYSLIMGTTGSTTKPIAKMWKELRGHDVSNAATVVIEKSASNAQRISVSQVKALTDYGWPSKTSVDPSSFLGTLRAKTSLSFDLPSEAQWEYASRGGSSTPMNIGTEVTEENAALVQGSEKLDSTGSHYIYVGNYMPNALGIYDMTSAMEEWCLDIYKESLGTSIVTNPMPTSITYDSKVLLKDASYGDKLYDDGTAIFDGNEYALRNDLYTQYSTYTYLRYTAYGIRRVVRGGGSRVALRSSELNLNDTGVIFTDGVKIRLYYGDILSSPGLPKYTNPTAGVRIALTVDE